MAGNYNKEGRHRTMKTMKSLGHSGLGCMALAVISSSVYASGADQNTVGAHNLVHRVSHSLADSQTYSRTSNSGYKWGKTAEPAKTSSSWAEATTQRSGYKWGTSDASQSNAPSYAGSASYEVETMGASEQTGYRWGLRNYADQTGYRWGLRNYADQTGYRWGLRNYADQTGYRWGLRNYADQTGYRWGLR